MKVKLFDGNSKHGSVCDCENFEEAEKLIKECAEKPYANLTFNDENFPNLTVKINGNFAVVLYEGNRGECIEEFDDYSEEDYDMDDPEESEDFIGKTLYAPYWRAQGNHSQPVKFLAGSFKKLTASDGNQVVALELALECVKEFYKTKSRPECIKNWERLI